MNFWTSTVVDTSGFPTMSRVCPSEFQTRGFLQNRNIKPFGRFSLTAGYRSEEARASLRLPRYNVERNLNDGCRVTCPRTLSRETWTTGVESLVLTHCRERYGRRVSSDLPSHNVGRGVNDRCRVVQDPRTGCWISSFHTPVISHSFRLLLK